MFIKLLPCCKYVNPLQLPLSLLKTCVDKLLNVKNDKMLNYHANKHLTLTSIALTVTLMQLFIFAVHLCTILKCRLDYLPVKWNVNVVFVVQYKSTNLYGN